MDDIAAREERSLARLRAIGLSIDEDAPISTPDPDLRTPAEVAARAIVLYVVAVRGAFLSPDSHDWKQRRFSYRGALYIVWSEEIDIPESLAEAESGDKDPGVELLQQRGLWDYVSPREREFLLDPEPDRQTCVNAAWRSECVHVLQWALGLIDEMEAYDTTSDMSGVTRVFLTTPIMERITEFALRPLPEILDEFDFLRRCQWLAYGARRRGEEPPKSLDPEIMSERHRALHWLLGINGEAWDDITLRT